MKSSIQPPPHLNSSNERKVCWKCRRAQVACYCSQVVPFDAGFDLALCIHPGEFRNPIGTARIIERFVSGTKAFIGTGPQLDRDSGFLNWLDQTVDPTYVLYPSPQALWLSAESPRSNGTKRHRIVVLDGTWSQAKQLLRTSNKLKSLPQIAFHPQHRSRYEIREQPAALCLSSLEAISQLIVLTQGEISEGHERMLGVFHQMVEYQLKKEQENHAD